MSIIEKIYYFLKIKKPELVSNGSYESFFWKFYIKFNNRQDIIIPVFPMNSCEDFVNYIKDKTINIENKTYGFIDIDTSKFNKNKIIFGTGVCIMEVGNKCV